MKNNNVKANESKKNAQVAEAKKPQAKKPVAETKPQVAPVEAPKTKAKKPTKEEIIRNLNAMSTVLAKMSKNKVKGATELLSRVVNAVGNSAKTKVDDLIALHNEVIQFGKEVADATTKKTVVENAIKPKAATKTAEKPKAPKKSEKPKAEEPLVEAVFQIGGNIPVARMFPETLEMKDLGKLVRADAKYDTMESVAEALEAGAQFYFATYWTKRHIKQFDYDGQTLTKGATSFPNDLDILEPVFYCERIKRIWAASLYTEAMFCFDNDTLKHIEDTNPYDESDKFKVRLCNGMEFELYELAPVAETKKATKK